MSPALIRLVHSSVGDDYRADSTICYKTIFVSKGFVNILGVHCSTTCNAQLDLNYAKEVTVQLKYSWCSNLHQKPSSRTEEDEVPSCTCILCSHSQLQTCRQERRDQARPRNERPNSPLSPRALRQSLQG